MNKQKLTKLLLLITWMSIIFILSNQPNSSEVTYNIIDKSLNITKTDNLINIINFIIRKSAHITEYLILTLLFYMFYKEYTKNKLLLLSTMSCFIYACTDEFHQLFITGRTGSIIDVLIDSIGAVIFIMIYYLSKRNKGDT